MLVISELDYILCFNFNIRPIFLYDASYVSYITKHVCCVQVRLTPLLTFLSFVLCRRCEHSRYIRWWTKHYSTALQCYFYSLFITFVRWMTVRRCKVALSCYTLCIRWTSPSSHAKSCTFNKQSPLSYTRIYTYLILQTWRTINIAQIYKTTIRYQQEYLFRCIFKFVRQSVCSICTICVLQTPRFISCLLLLIITVETHTSCTKNENK